MEGVLEAPSQFAGKPQRPPCTRAGGTARAIAHGPPPRPAPAPSRPNRRVSLVETPGEDREQRDQRRQVCPHRRIHVPPLPQKWWWPVMIHADLLRLPTRFVLWHAALLRVQPIPASAWASNSGCPHPCRRLGPCRPGKTPRAPVAPIVRYSGSNIVSADRVARSGDMLSLGPLEEVGRAAPMTRQSLSDEIGVVMLPASCSNLSASEHRPCRPPHASPIVRPQILATSPLCGPESNMRIDFQGVPAVHFCTSWQERSWF